MNNVPPGTWIAEMRKADERLQSFPDGNNRKFLGKPRAAAMRWALDFARKQLDEISEGDFVNLQRELVCFYVFEMKEPFLHRNVAAYDPWPNREEMRTTQRWLQGIVRGISAKEVLPFAETEKRRYLCYSAEDQRWVEAYTSRRVMPPGIGELFALIREHLNDLRECKAGDCGLLFLRDRSNQDFCSRRHQWLHSQRTKQGISPDRYGKRGRPAGVASKPPKRKKTLNTKKGGKHAAKKR